MGELPTWIQDNMGTDQNAPQNWIDPTNVKKKFKRQKSLKRT